MERDKFDDFLGIKSEKQQRVELKRSITMSTRGRGSKAHIHKYHYVQMGYDKVWACALGDCTHFMPKHMEAMVLGKKSICWSCNQEFHLDEESMKNPEPVCLSCANQELIKKLAVI